MASKGRRYNGEKPKLNIKKVIAVIIAFAVLIMIITGIGKSFKGDNKVSEKTVPNRYFAVYTNDKWGVINSKGEIIIKPEYDETIVIPDSSKDIFLCTYNVNYSENTYQTKVINSKGQEIITGYDTIIALENYDDSNNIWYENDVLVVSKDGKYGLVDYKGKELLKCEYEQIEALKGVKNSILTKKDGKFGLTDNIGSTIIENEYKKIASISDKYENGYIVTNESNKKGIIKRDKTIAVECKYDDVKSIYANDKYVVKEDGAWQIVDAEKNTYLKNKYDDIVSVDGDDVIIKDNGKYGVVTLDNQSKIAAKYQEISYLFEENYIFKQNNKYGVINLAGEELIKPTYDSLIYRADAGFLEGEKSGQINSDFIGNDLEVKLSGIISEINVEDGYMKIRTDDDYKYYNFKFEEKTKQELLTTNTIFLDKKDGKYGYVNKNGIVVVDYIYDDAREQNEFGYASVKKDGMWGCVDSKGKIAITTAYKLENNSLIEFIGKWHLGEDLNLNYYTDK